MDISIFGLGYVGCVNLGCLASFGHFVIGVDIDQFKVAQINSGKATIIEKGINTIIANERSTGRITATTDYVFAIKNSDISIVAVGTTSTKKGHFDLRHVFKVAENIGEALIQKDKFHIIVIRSTIIPGTCNQFANIVEKISGKKRNKDFVIVCNPEFLREGTAVHDYYNPPLTLIGSDNTKMAAKIADLYKQLPGEIIITDLDVVEIMKCINNTFHALKVSFCNEVGNICSKIGIDSYKVMEIFCKDKQLNISPYYLKPGFAYGGSCLPKDLKALQTLSRDLSINVPIIKSIHKTNQIQIKRAIEIINNYQGKKLGFLGISFKSGTDDLRNSPIIKVIESLLQKGFDITIYDKRINLARLTGTNRKFIESKIPHLSNLLIKDFRNLIAKCDVIILNTREFDLKKFIENTHNKIIIDFIHIDELLLTRNNYIGINW